MGSPLRTGRTAPPGGNGKSTEILSGVHAVGEALSAGGRHLLRILVLHRDRKLAEIIRLARSVRVPVQVVPRQTLDRLVPGGKHQGVVGQIVPKSYVEPEEILAHARNRREPPLVLILDNVQDPQNLGAVLRTAEAAGVHGVYLPERHTVGLTAAVARASAGALEYLRVARITNLSRLIESLQRDGFWIYALDPRGTRAYYEVDLRGSVGLIVGGEGKGIRQGVLEKCDERIRIPMRGHIASLNVSASAAVAIFEAIRQRALVT